MGGASRRLARAGQAPSARPTESLLASARGGVVPGPPTQKALCGVEIALQCARGNVSYSRKGPCETIVSRQDHSAAQSHPLRGHFVSAALPHSHDRQPPHRLRPVACTLSDHHDGLPLLAAEWWRRGLASRSRPLPSWTRGPRPRGAEIDSAPPSSPVDVEGAKEPRGGGTRRRGDART